MSPRINIASISISNPSLSYQLVACGAEAVALESDYATSHAEHFKMQLHPNSKPASRRRFQGTQTIPDM